MAPFFYGIKHDGPRNRNVDSLIVGNSNNCFVQQVGRHRYFLSMRIYRFFMIEWARFPWPFGHKHEIRTVFFFDIIAQCFFFRRCDVRLFRCTPHPAQDFFCLCHCDTRIGGNPTCHQTWLFAFIFIIQTLL